MHDDGVKGDPHLPIATKRATTEIRGRMEEPPTRPRRYPDADSKIGIDEVRKKDSIPNEGATAAAVAAAAMRGLA
jgi:hypothetical protein